jgi:hypothetical protein
VHVDTVLGGTHAIYYIVLADSYIYYTAGSNAIHTAVA